ncbi:MAG TPA: aspartate-semialdehyde dehydrogenase [Thermoplasmata archaeon]|nr:aspartate-semialdehyde dehydrogenase [Thermoplasmata archaeon]
MTTINVAVIGATGAVGQTFVRLLEGHPWFHLTELVATDRHAGTPYGESVAGIGGDAPAFARAHRLRTVEDDLDADVCFSALPGGKAAAIERSLADRGYKVFTNARDLRLEEDVPLVIPEVNPEHLALVDRQPSRSRGGFVVANGNCTAIILALALKPLADRFGLEACHVVSMQALSGAGYPGVPSLDITDNLIPYIADEEGKVESEVPKILGRWNGGGIAPAPVAVSATCTRVPVIDGHTLAVSARFTKPAEAEEICDAWTSFSGAPQQLRLPTAPDHPILYRQEADRPQPRRDRGAGNGMTVTVGRLRPDPLLGWKFIVSGSNTVRGAAGASLLNAELAAAKGFL